MHRIADRHRARLSIVVLALLVALGAVMFVRLHRAAALSEASGAAGGASAAGPAAASASPHP